MAKKPDKNEWIKIRINKELPIWHKAFRDTAGGQYDYDITGSYYKQDQKRYIESKIRARTEELSTLYEKVYGELRYIPPAKFEKVPKVPGMEKYAKTRDKAGNELFNLKYLVENKSPKQFVRFVKATHGRTLKKMLTNNIKVAESQGARNWTARAKKFIKEFKGSKEELAYQIAERYGGRLAQYSGDLLRKGTGEIVRQTERLTKSGKIRKRYLRRDTNLHLDELEKSNKYRMANIDRAIYRMFKIDNRGKDFDADGNGIITQYWLNRIRDFAAIPRAGLADLEDKIFDSIVDIGIIGNQKFYQVKLSARAIKVLKDTRLQSTASQAYYGRAFVELYKKSTK